MYAIRFIKTRQELRSIFFILKTPLFPQVPIKYSPDLEKNTT